MIRTIGSAEFGILEKIMGFFLKERAKRYRKRKKNERKRARNDFEKYTWR